MIGIDPDFDCLFDRQMDRPVCFCLKCKREIYCWGLKICDYCLEDDDDEEWG